MKNMMIVMTLLGGSLLPLSAWSQECSDGIEASTPDTQLVDNGDGTIKDTLTGLMWKKCSEGQTGLECSGDAAGFTLQEALNNVQSLNKSGGFAGYKDWRVPNIKELFSIVEKRCANPAVSVRFFPNTPFSSGVTSYLTSSPVADKFHSTWSVYFSYGDVFDTAAEKQAVRLVR